MTMQQAQARDDLWVVLEGTGYLFLLASGALALNLGWITLGTGVMFSVCLLLSLLLLAWKRFDGGRHPSFLFLGMLIVFQGGRLIGYTFGDLDDPFQIVVQTAVPIDVARSTSEIALLLIMLSAICVYLPSRWRFRPVKLEASSSEKWLPAAYFLLTLTLPFLIYKNYLYLSYIRSHGGYLAVYTQGDSIVKTAGTFVRAVSSIVHPLFIIISVLERRRKYLVPVTVLFIASSTLELLIGFRGKFFLLLITLWYLNNLKKGTKFRILPLAGAVASLSILAVLISEFRENRTARIINPVMFISNQGTSLGVTEAAIEYRRTFQSHGVDYLVSSLGITYQRATQFGEGELFANDISLFLNRNAFYLGFATGSSYLAEAYLAGGMLLTVFASVGIGLALRLLHVASKHTFGALTMILLLPSFIYMPRSGLLGPIDAGIKSGIGVLVVCSLFLMIRSGNASFAAAIHRLARPATDRAPR